MARLPWYAFLYRLFGAQGTFWLWVLSLVALWWTARPTVIRLANRRPKIDMRVAEVAAMPATDLTRWVRLQGVAVDLDARLLLEKDPPPTAPVTLLIDPADPAAGWWATTHALAEAMGPGGPAASAGLGGLAGAAHGGAARVVRNLLEGRLARLEGGSVPEAFPAPGRAVLVQRVGEARAPAPPEPPPVTTDFAEAARARLGARAALVRARVTPDVELEGQLVAMPVTLAARVKDELHTVLAPQLLQAGREPRDLESWVFAAAAITLLFLAAGFHGVTRPAAAPAPTSPEPARAPGE